MKDVESVTLHVWLRLSYPMWKQRKDFVTAEEMLKESPRRLSLETLSVGVIGILSKQHLVFGSTGKPDGEVSGWIWWSFDKALTEEKWLEVQKALEECFGEAGRDFCWDGTVTVVKTAEARALGKFVQ